jgi:hypothetical protein
MNAAPMTIMPILATPLGIAALADAPQLNPALTDLFAQRAAADRKPQNPLRYTSADDLFTWQEAPVRRLAEGIAGALYAFIGSVSDIAEENLRACKLEARAWFTRLRTNGAVAAANHPLTTWCAIYCVAAPAPAQDRADSGVVRLYESRLGSSFQDATNSALRIPFSASHYAWRPAAGSLVIFPASLTYEVALLRAADELLLVTARLRFVGQGQQGFSRW